MRGGGRADAQPACPPVGSDCSDAYFETECGEIEWNNHFDQSPPWECQSTVEASINAVVSGAVQESLAEPRELYNSAGLIRTQLAVPATAYTLDETSIPITTPVYTTDFSAVPARSLEAAVHEAASDPVSPSHGARIATCREVAFHAWQDWSELFDVYEQESWTSSDFYEEAYTGTHRLAKLVNPGQPWDPSTSNTWVPDHRDRGGHLFQGVQWLLRRLSAVRDWDPVAKMPWEFSANAPPPGHPMQVTPSFEDHYERGQYAASQGWSHSELNQLWDRQKDLAFYMGAIARADAVRIESIIEDLNRGGSTPDAAWALLDQMFIDAYPALESLTPGRCKYKQLVQYSSRFSQEAFGDTLINEVWGGPSPEPPAHGGARKRIIRERPPQDPYLNGFPGEFGDPIFDPLHNHGGTPLPPRDADLFDPYGFGPLNPHNLSCHLMDQLLKLQNPSHDFFHQSLQQRESEAYQAQQVAAAEADAVFQELVVHCPQGTARTKCDWAPDAFLENVLFTFEDRLVKTEAKCIEQTSDDLDDIVQDFFSVYPAALMSKHLNHADPQCGPPCPADPTWWPEWQRMIATDYTQDVGAFLGASFNSSAYSNPGLYADIALYAQIRQYVFEQGLKAMADHVAEKLPGLGVNGKPTFRQSELFSRSTSHGKADGAIQFDVAGDFQYPDAVADNYEMAHIKGTGATRVGMANDAKILNSSEKMLDALGDIQKDGATGKSTSNHSLSLAGKQANASVTYGMPFTVEVSPYKLKYSFLTLIAADNKIPPPRAPLAQVGPLTIWAEGDIIGYFKVKLKLEIDEAGLDLTDPTAFRAESITITANVGVEGFIAVFAQLAVVEFGIKFELVFMDLAMGAKHASKREPAYFTESTANALLPDLKDIGQCRTDLFNVTECQGMNLWKRGPMASNSVIEEKSDWKFVGELTGLKMTLKAFVRIVFVTLEATIVSTPGLRAPFGDKDDTSTVNTASMVACQERLDAIPSTWNRATCLVEVPHPGP